MRLPEVPQHPFSHMDIQAWRRSYGLLASGDAATAGVNAAPARHRPRAAAGGAADAATAFGDEQTATWRGAELAEVRVQDEGQSGEQDTGRPSVSSRCFSPRSSSRSPLPVC